MKEERFYTPTDTARLLGISKQTLLRYEAKGIFPHPKRNAVNGWREYTRKDIQRLKRILGRG